MEVMGRRRIGSARSAMWPGGIALILAERRGQRGLAREYCIIVTVVVVLTLAVAIGSRLRRSRGRPGLRN